MKELDGRSSMASQLVLCGPSFQFLQTGRSLTTGRHIASSVSFLSQGALATLPSHTPRGRGLWHHQLPPWLSPLLANHEGRPPPGAYSRTRRRNSFHRESVPPRIGYAVSPEQYFREYFEFRVVFQIWCTRRTALRI